MGIVVACRCGQAFEADAWLAGKVVQCPVCRSPLVVPTPIEAPPQYIPRPVSPVARESREATESMWTFLVAGVVIFVAVLSFSVGIVGYIRWKNPTASIPAASPAASPAPATSDPPMPGGTVAATSPIATPNAAQAVEPSPVTASSVESTIPIPTGWSRYQHSVARFSAILPAPPEVIVRKVENLADNRTVHILTATQDEHVYEASREFRPFSVASGEEGFAYDVLARSRAAEIEGSILRSENLTVADRPIRDVILQGTVDGVQVRKYLRLIVHGDSVLELSCLVPMGKERASDIGAFLANYTMD